MISTHIGWKPVRTGLNFGALCYTQAADRRGESTAESAASTRTVCPVGCQARGINGWLFGVIRSPSSPSHSSTRMPAIITSSIQTAPNLSPVGLTLRSPAPRTKPPTPPNHTTRPHPRPSPHPHPHTHTHMHTDTPTHPATPTHTDPPTHTHTNASTGSAECGSRLCSRLLLVGRPP